VTRAILLVDDPWAETAALAADADLLLPKPFSPLRLLPLGDRIRAG